MQNQKPFDDFIMVDWSASSSLSPANPDRAKDSIWLANLQYAEHYRTRYSFFVSFKRILQASLTENKRVLCGFDFCFGLPHGAVDKMRKATNDNSDVKNWQWLWQYLDDKIKDDEKNRNNRFQVASEMNYHLSSDNGPFWGCPAEQETEYLSMKKNKSITGDRFDERRVTEGGNMGLSVWQLAYTGAVGSQSLLGMAYLNRLRLLDELKEHVAVYPFEDIDSALIVFAESYYGRSDMPIDATVIPKDKGQVMAAVEWCRRLQDKGELQNFLLRPKDPKISQDEGWTFTEPMPPHIETY